MKYLTPLTIAIAIASISCDGRISVDSSAKSSSGVTRKATQVATDADGWTQEQKNIADRLKVDNTPGAIKHLYIISPYSGQTILYSTVKSKVTSGGKRLTPNTVATDDGQQVSGEFSGMTVNIAGRHYRTNKCIHKMTELTVHLVNTFIGLTLEMFTISTSLPGVKSFTLPINPFLLNLSPSTLKHNERNYWMYCCIGNRRFAA